MRFTRLVFGYLLLAGWISAYASEDQIAAVSSRVSSDYVRAKRADGTFEPEAYAFGPGGHWAATPPIPRSTS